MEPWTQRGDGEGPAGRWRQELTAQRARARRNPGVCGRSRALRISIANERRLSVCLHDTREGRSEKKPFSPPPSHSTRKQFSVDKHHAANNVLANATAEGLAPLC